MRPLLIEAIVLARRDRMDVVEFLGELRNGDLFAWGTLGFIVATVAGIGIYNKLTGSDIGSKQRRREGARRGKIVLFEYKRRR